MVDGRTVGADGKALPRDQVKGVPDESVFETSSPKLISYVPGRGYERYRPGVTKRLKAGTYLVWSQHYTPSGKPEKDRTRVGLYFAKGPVTHEIYTHNIGNALPTDPNQTRRYIAEGTQLSMTGRRDEEGRNRGVPNIPPYADNWKLVGVTPVTENITAYSFHPHFHLRGKEVTYVLTYPDGREEVILHVPKYDFNWQLNYELEEPLKIPAGSKITSVITFDNSLKNPYNPAPHQEVWWSEQSWDEMYSPFIEISVDSLDLTKRRPRSTQQQQQ